MRLLGTLSIISHSSVVLAWVGESSRLDLLWPPPQAEKEVVVDTETVSPAEVSGDSGFPCAHIPIPDNVDRIDFPIVGGQVEYNLTALGAASSVPDDGDFMVNYYFGQFNNNMTISQDNFVRVDSWYWNSTNFRADLGSFCTPIDGPLGNYAINLTESIYGEPYELAYLPEIEGINATFGAELVVFGREGSDTRAIMNVCSYVRLTYNPRSWGPCQEHNAVTSTTLAPTASPTITGLTSTGHFGTVTAYPTVSPDPTSSSASTGVGHNSKTAIGAGVGGVAGAALLILALGYFLLRRRRRARASIIKVVPINDDENQGGDKKAILESKDKSPKEKIGGITDGPETKILRGKDDLESKNFDSVKAESSGSSIRSEPLPSYAEATKSKVK